MPHSLYDADPLLSPLAFSPTSSSASHPAPTGRGPLHRGAVFAGVQRSGRNSYDVLVKIDDVDVAEGRVCGTLEIRGLTPELDSLATFFEGEIVGEAPLPGFRTGKYGASESDDLKHFKRFPAFTRNRLDKQMVGLDMNLKSAKNRPYLFMRWKERFVIPGRVEAIHGASYAGFYYVCLDCEPSSVPADPSLSPHRGISPAPRMPSFSRRTSSTARSPLTPTTEAPSSGLLTQTRPAPPASSGQTQVNLPSPAETPRPAPPRRMSSGSYAAAVRGNPGSPPSFMDLSSPTSSPSLSASTSSMPPTPLDHPPAAPTNEGVPMAPPPTEFPTPKLDSDSALAFANAFSSTSSSSADGPPQLPPVAALSPFPAPVSAFTSTAEEARLGLAVSSSTTALADSEWPAPSSPPSRFTRPLTRRMSSDVASVVARTSGARGRPANKRRESIAEEEGGKGEWEGFDDCGLKSWTDATISGFYFHHSASPYQELSLRYVPTTRGGSADFAFR